MGKHLPGRVEMKEVPILILALATIVSVLTAKEVKPGPCFKFKVTNEHNLTRIELEHDEGSTVEASADSCNGKRILNISISTPAAPVSRHPDYELFPEYGYYRLHPVALNWESAKSVCNAEGGHLVVINSEAEMNLVVALLQRKVPFSGAAWNDWVWVGLKRDFGGVVKTIFGDPMTKAGYAVWHEGEPNKDGDCVLIHTTGTLADQNCAKLGAYICEVAL